MGRISHVVGVDDAPFPRTHRGDVLVVGTVFAGRRLEGILSSKVRRDGANATQRLATMIGECRYAEHLQGVLLQGIALAGFNVVDIYALHEALGLPILVVVRKRPDLNAVRRALLSRVPGGARKWRLVQKAGAVEPAGGLYVQRAGLTLAQAARLLADTTVRGKLPEPIRVAHLVAGGVTDGESRSRP